METGVPSALDRAYHQTLDEVFLQEGVDHEHRQNGNHHDGVFQLAFRDERLRRGGCGVGGGHAGDVAVDDHFADDHLQGHLAGIRQVQQGGEVAVPMPHSVEQHQRGHDCLGQGEDDAQEGLEGAGPVDLRRLVKLLGDGGKKRPHDNHVVGADGPRQHNGPHR